MSTQQPGEKNKRKRLHSKGKPLAEDHPPGIARQFSFKHSFDRVHQATVDEGFIL
jgi:hypothetical protein